MHALLLGWLLFIEFPTLFQALHDTLKGSVSSGNLTNEEMLAQRIWKFVEGHTAKQRLGSNPSLYDFNASDFP